MKYFTRTFFIIVLILSVAVSSCLKSTNPGIPESVRKTLESSGINQPNLMRAVVNYSRPADSLRQKALFWLLTNMRGNYTVHYSIEDSTGKKYLFPPAHYLNLENLELSWDSVEVINGPLHYQADSFLLDQKQTTTDFLKTTIDQAFDARNTFSWAKKYDFELFSKWILPYRCANEQIENFRSHFIKKYSSYFVKKDSIPVLEAALILNQLVNLELVYKDSYEKEINVQTIEQLEKSRSGNFYDLNIYKIKVLRSFGIAAALDYTPYLADTTFGYAWTTVILPDRSEFTLEFPQKVHNLGKPGRIAKVYRRTFERDSTSLYAIKQPNQPTPPYLGSFFYNDITNPLNSKSVWLPYYKKTNYAYLAVFNNGDWHPIDWSIPQKASGTHFNRVGTGAVYLPVELKKKKLYRLGSPFLLLDNGYMKEFKPDFTFEQKTLLAKTGPYQNIDQGASYTLYIWNGNWSSLFSFTGKKNGISAFLPVNGLYLLTNDDPIRNERIFSVSEKGHQIFY
ncbi:MAG: hypothetical protein JXR65_01280 [Bacteroidales bacterium]|nr:hypothetical protein [Bacteroidales bacterium]